MQFACSSHGKDEQQAVLSDDEVAEYLLLSE
jgi:hypothetical protein